MNLEITVGEGPGTDASKTGQAVDEQNLLVTESARWVIYAPRALAAALGRCSVFPFGSERCDLVHSVSFVTNRAR